jgi:putative aldouronate transport system permease protein
MLIPSFLLVLYFSYAPVAGIFIAFQDFQPASGWFGSPWVGLANFRYILELPSVWRILGNTVLIAFLKGFFGLFTPVVVALLMNELRSLRFRRWVQTFIYLPHFLSWVILAGIFIDLLSMDHGVINAGIKALGLKPVFFMGDNRWFPAVLVSTEVWKEFGFNSVVFLAALADIDPTLYEAATIDGAGHAGRMWHVTLPGISAIIVLCALLNLGGILNAGFEQVFNMYSPVVYRSGDIVDTFVYRLGIQDAQFAAATAVGLFRSVASVVLLSTAYYLAYRLADYRIF